jgi:hypothetical protein
MFTGSCQVINQGTNKLKPCVFPFVIDGRRFDECTTDLDPNQGDLLMSIDQGD